MHCSLARKVTALKESLRVEQEKNLALENQRLPTGKISNLVPVFHTLPFCPESAVQCLVEQQVEQLEKERRLTSVERGTQARYKDTILHPDGSNK